MQLDSLDLYREAIEALAQREKMKQKEALFIQRRRELLETGTSIADSTTDIMLYQ